jgi:K+-transporting ATPase ATPase C chain
MLKQIRPALVMIVFMTLLLGIAYPFAMTGLSGLMFKAQAGGSLVRDSAGQVVGSALIAQGFAKPEYLHPRPSAAGMGYDASASSGSNLGPLDSKLSDRMNTDAGALKKEAPGAVIPADAITTSGSGLDPDVSPENAVMQIPRIAAARGVSAGEVQKIIEEATTARELGILGEPRVNVLAVNRALDARLSRAGPKT